MRIEHGRYVGGGTLTASFDNLANFPNHPRWFVRGYEYHVAVTPGTQRMVGAEVLHRRLFPWLEQHAGESFFLFVHYWDVHGPYLAPPPYGADYPGQRVGEAIPVHRSAGGADYVRGWGPVAEVTPEARARIDAYDGGIAYFDAMFGNLLDHLDALGIGRQAVVALTADHGESLAEHRVPFAHDALYDATVHVPLIVRAPGALPAGRVVEALSQAVDVAPTLLDLAGLPEAAATPSIQGRSLRPLATTEPGAQIRQRGAVQTERAYSEWTRYLASRSIRDQRHKLIHWFTGGLALARPAPRRVSWVELYDLLEDPDETHDLAAEQTRCDAGAGGAAAGVGGRAAPAGRGRSPPAAGAGLLGAGGPGHRTRRTAHRGGPFPPPPGPQPLALEVLSCRRRRRERSAQGG